MINLRCLLYGHIWENDTMSPMHGYRNQPNIGSYCVRCGKVTE